VTQATIEIFRAGTHTAMNNETIGFSEADLKASADAYDPKKHEAPIVVGHPSTDAPAYGWVHGLQQDGASLQARLDQVDSKFAEAVRDGKYKKVSASFYKPDSPNNPVGGVYYLRHVGFLGAQPPSLKGLQPVELGEAGDDAVTIEFGEVSGFKIGDALRSLRDWLISQFGTEAADEALPPTLVTSVQEEAAADDAEGEAAGFADPSHRTTEGPVTGKTPGNGGTQPAPATDPAELARREREVQRREAEFAEQQRQQRRTQREQFLDGLVKDGRPLPCEKNRLLAFMDSLDGRDAVQFGEGETQDPNKFLMDEVLGRLPKQVEYGERAPADPQPDEATDAQALARDAVAYQEKMRGSGIEVSTSEAVAAVSQPSGKTGA